MSSMIALNQIDGSELWKKVGFEPSEKVLAALRGVYNLPFNLDDPVHMRPPCLNYNKCFTSVLRVSEEQQQTARVDYQNILQLNKYKVQYFEIERNRVDTRDS